MFITFEGGEGTGKSTQVKLLAERFRALGMEVLTTREPGGTPDAEALRHLLVSGDAGRWTSNEELLLNFAARGSHLRNVIKPALNTGQIVICDRFVDSSFVYQVVAGGARHELFSELVYTIASESVPNVTIVLDIAPEIALQRAIAREDGLTIRSDRFEKKGAEFHQKVRDGFRRVVQDQPNRCHLIDASGSVENVQDAIWKIING